MRPTGRQVRVRLNREGYDRLRHQVMARDSWRCQFCGAQTQLEVHHLQFRSRAGLDEEENLITLCARCHRNIHGGSD